MSGQKASSHLKSSGGPYEMKDDNSESRKERSIRHVMEEDHEDRRSSEFMKKSQSAPIVVSDSKATFERSKELWSKKAKSVQDINAKRRSRARATRPGAVHERSPRSTYEKDWRRSASSQKRSTRPGAVQDKSPKATYEKNWRGSNVSEKSKRSRRPNASWSNSQEVWFNNIKKSSPKGHSRSNHIQNIKPRPPPFGINSSVTAPGLDGQKDGKKSIKPTNNVPSAAEEAASRKRLAIQAVFQDTSLTPQEKHRRVQAIQRGEALPAPAVAGGGADADVAVDHVVPVAETVEESADRELLKRVLNLENDLKQRYQSMFADRNDPEAGAFQTESQSGQSQYTNDMNVSDFANARPNENPQATATNRVVMAIQRASIVFKGDSDFFQEGDSSEFLVAESKRRRKGVVCCILILLFFGGVGAAVYFLALAPKAETAGVANPVEGTPTEAPVSPLKTMAPTEMNVIPGPSVAPTIVPTAMPSSNPTLAVLLPTEPTQTPAPLPTPPPTSPPTIPPTPPPTPPPTSPPTPPPTSTPTEQAVDRLGEVLNVIFPGESISEDSAEYRTAVWAALNDSRNPDINSVEFRERFTLANLYFATKGESWNRRSGWMGGDNHCNWESVSCRNGQVAELDLRDNNMSGTMVRTWGNLAQISRLRMSDNALSGSVPAEIGGMSNLGRLELSQNLLNGEFPTHVGQLTQLTNLQIRNNFFRGTIPTQLGRLNRLQSFVAEFNQFTGQLPDELSGMTSLRNIYLGRNQLAGPIPASFGSFSQLTLISISENRLSGAIPSELGRLTNLKRFSVAQNRFSSSIPDEFGAWTAMTYLSVFDNQLTGTIPASLRQWKNTGTIYFYETGIKGSMNSFCSSANAGTADFEFYAECGLECSCCTHCCNNQNCISV